MGRKIENRFPVRDRTQKHSAGWALWYTYMLDLFAAPIFHYDANCAHFPATKDNNLPSTTVSKRYYITSQEHILLWL